MPDESQPHEPHEPYQPEPAPDAYSPVPAPEAYRSAPLGAQATPDPGEAAPTDTPVEPPPHWLPPLQPGAIGSGGRPHRGGSVLTLGLVGLASSAVSCGCCVLAAPIGLILSILAWAFAAGDLKAMRAGVIDPSGEGSTRAGMILGIIGVVLGSLAILGNALYLAGVLASGAADGSF